MTMLAKAISVVENVIQKKNDVCNTEVSGILKSISLIYFCLNILPKKPYIFSYSSLQPKNP